jgi:hypothetical protein
MFEVRDDLQAAGISSRQEGAMNAVSGCSLDVSHPERTGAD